MSGYFRALATDLDGTLTVNGRLDMDALAALDALRAHDVVTLLVTGRIRDELDAEFPGLAAHFDAVVAENGAVVATPRGTRLPAAPVETELEKALTELDVPCRRGRVLLACDGNETAVVAEQVQSLGLDCQLVHNRSALRGRSAASTCSSSSVRSGDGTRPSTPHGSARHSSTSYSSHSADPARPSGRRKRAVAYCHPVLPRIAHAVRTAACPPDTGEPVPGRAARCRPQSPVGFVD